MTDQSNRSLAGELLGYLILVLCGMAFMTWWASLSPGERQTFVDRSLGVLTLLLAQPGVFVSAKILSSSSIAWRKRAFWGLTVFAVFAFAIPLGISNWLQSVLQF